MHNLVKIKIFRILLKISYPFALVFVYPFVLLKKKSKSHIFFFFDRFVIGGAQRIHLDILNALDDQDKEVFFTRRSVNNGLKEEFYSIPKTYCTDIHFWCDNLLFRLISVHYYSFFINRHSSLHVFSANSTFFYDMLPFLHEKIIKTELLHNFTFGKNGMEYFGLANVTHLTNRVVYDAYTLSNIKKQYSKYNIDAGFIQRIHFIEPGVNIPPAPQKNLTPPLNILYAGRGGKQKRIYLLNRIAEYFIKQSSPVIFHFAGTMADELSDLVKSKAVLHGEISSPEKMYELYKSTHAILMTSAYEGFPMLIKEGMACGCVPVVTALEGNKMHLTDNENSLLINAVENEEEVVRLGIEQVKKLLEKELLEKLSANAYNYAKEYFNKAKFIEQYRALFLT
ncbi:MAG: hypothetical protein JWN76_1048 [Chitinophagaceae bacterium]|nr:hypothetical protein [Chitinophagaceae bacterium]